VDSQASERKPSFMVFPPQLVAQQFTLIDAVSVSCMQGRGGIPSGLCCPDLPTLVQSRFPVHVQLH
jgi:hypothetical protein